MLQCPRRRFTVLTFLLLGPGLLLHTATQGDDNIPAGNGFQNLSILLAPERCEALRTTPGAFRHLAYLGAALSVSGDGETPLAVNTCTPSGLAPAVRTALTELFAAAAAAAPPPTPGGSAQLPSVLFQIASCDGQLLVPIGLLGVATEPPLAPLPSGDTAALSPSPTATPAVAPPLPASSRAFVAGAAAASLSSDKVSVHSFLADAALVLGELAPAGSLMLLRDLAAKDASLDTGDILPPLRRKLLVGEVGVGGSVLPLDAPALLLVYRWDVLRAMGREAPSTWDELAQLVESYDTSRPAWAPAAALCAVTGPTCDGLELFTAIWHALAQSRGLAQGVYFEPRTLRPLVRTAAFRAAARLFARMWRRAVPQPAGACGYSHPGLRLGTCALAIGTFEQVKDVARLPAASQQRQQQPSGNGGGSGQGDDTASAGTATAGSVTFSVDASSFRVTQLPGATRVQSPDDPGSLVECTRGSCPYGGETVTAGLRVVADSDLASAGDGGVQQQRQRRSCATRRVAQEEAEGRGGGGGAVVNRAPYIPSSVLVGGISSRSTTAERLLAWNVLSYLADPLVSLQLLLEPGSGGLLPFRTSHFLPDARAAWAVAGYDAVHVNQGLDELYDAVQHPNLAWGLHMAGGAVYRNALSDFLTALLNSSAATMPGAGADADRLALLTDKLYDTLAGHYSSSPSASAATARQYAAFLNFGSYDADRQQVQSAAGGGGASDGTSRAVALGVALAFAGLAVGAVALFTAYRRGCGGLRGRRWRRWSWRRDAPAVSPYTTLLVTDIEGSTQLWEELPEAVMGCALRLHHACLRRVLVRHQGYESATEGDSFILAFHRPDAALAFAMEAQQELLQQDWPPELLATQACAPVYTCAPSGFPFRRIAQNALSRINMGVRLHSLPAAGFEAGAGGGACGSASPSAQQLARATAAAADRPSLQHSPSLSQSRLRSSPGPRQRMSIDLGLLSNLSREEPQALALASQSGGGSIGPIKDANLAGLPPRQVCASLPVPLAVATAATPVAMTAVAATPVSLGPHGSLSRGITASARFSAERLEHGGFGDAAASLVQQLGGRQQSLRSGGGSSAVSAAMAVPAAAGFACGGGSGAQEASARAVKALGMQPTAATAAGPLVGEQPQQPPATGTLGGLSRKMPELREQELLPLLQQQRQAAPPAQPPPPLPHHYQKNQLRPTDLQHHMQQQQQGLTDEVSVPRFSLNSSSDWLIIHAGDTKALLDGEDAPPAGLSTAAAGISAAGDGGRRQQQHRHLRGQLLPPPPEPLSAPAAVLLAATLSTTSRTPRVSGIAARTFDGFVVGGAGGGRAGADGGGSSGEAALEIASCSDQLFKLSRVAVHAAAARTATGGGYSCAATDMCARPGGGGAVPSRAQTRASLAPAEAACGRSKMPHGGSPEAAGGAYLTGGGGGGCCWEVSTLEESLRAAARGYEEAAPSDRRRRLLWRGLRIRMGLHSGVASGSELAYNRASARTVYSGQCASVVRVVADSAQGGLVLLSEACVEALTAGGGGGGGLRGAAAEALLVNVGRYRVALPEPSVAVAVDPGDGLAVGGGGMSLFLATSADLAPRAALLPPPRKISPVGLTLYGAPVGRAAIACLNIPDAATLAEWDEAATRQALGLVRCVVLEQLAVHRGFLVSEDWDPGGGGGTGLMAAFAFPLDAVRWALRCRELLTSADLTWPLSLLAHDLHREADMPRMYLGAAASQGSRGGGGLQASGSGQLLSPVSGRGRTRTSLDLTHALTASCDSTPYSPAPVVPPMAAAGAAASPRSAAPASVPAALAAIAALRTLAGPRGVEDAVLAMRDSLSAAAMEHGSQPPYSSAAAGPRAESLPADLASSAAAVATPTGTRQAPAAERGESPRACIVAVAAGAAVAGVPVRPGSSPRTSGRTKYTGDSAGAMAEGAAVVPTAPPPPPALVMVRSSVGGTDGRSEPKAAAGTEIGSGATPRAAGDGTAVAPGLRGVSTSGGGGVTAAAATPPEAASTSAAAAAAALRAGGSGAEAGRSSNGCGGGGVASPRAPPNLTARMMLARTKSGDDMGNKHMEDDRDMFSLQLGGIDGSVPVVGCRAPPVSLSGALAAGAGSSTGMVAAAGVATAAAAGDVAAAATTTAAPRDAAFLRGPRIRVGIDCGPVEWAISAVHHCLAYSGTPVTAAEKLVTAAAAGQVLASYGTMAELYRMQAAVAAATEPEEEAATVTAAAAAVQNGAQGGGAGGGSGSFGFEGGGGGALRGPAVVGTALPLPSGRASLGGSGRHRRQQVFSCRFTRDWREAMREHEWLLAQQAAAAAAGGNLSAVSGWSSPRSGRLSPFASPWNWSGRSRRSKRALNVAPAAQQQDNSGGGGGATRRSNNNNAAGATAPLRRSFDLFRRASAQLQRRSGAWAGVTQTPPPSAAHGRLPYCGGGLVVSGSVLATAAAPSGQRLTSSKSHPLPFLNPTPVPTLCPTNLCASAGNHAGRSRTFASAGPPSCTAAAAANAQRNSVCVSGWGPQLSQGDGFGGNGGGTRRAARGSVSSPCNVLLPPSPRPSQPPQLSAASGAATAAAAVAPSHRTASPSAGYVAMPVSPFGGDFRRSSRMMGGPSWRYDAQAGPCADEPVPATAGAGVFFAHSVDDSMSLSLWHQLLSDFKRTASRVAVSSGFAGFAGGGNALILSSTPEYDLTQPGGEGERDDVKEEEPREGVFDMTPRTQPRPPPALHAAYGTGPAACDFRSGLLGAVTTAVRAEAAMARVTATTATSLGSMLPPYTRTLSAVAPPYGLTGEGSSAAAVAGGGDGGGDDCSGGSGSLRDGDAREQENEGSSVRWPLEVTVAAQQRYGAAEGAGEKQIRSAAAAAPAARAKEEGEDGGWRMAAEGITALEAVAGAAVSAAAEQARGIDMELCGGIDLASGTALKGSGGVRPARSGLPAAATASDCLQEVAVAVSPAGRLGAYPPGGGPTTEIASPFIVRRPPRAWGTSPQQRLELQVDLDLHLRPAAAAAAVDFCDTFDHQWRRPTADGGAPAGMGGAAAAVSGRWVIDAGGFAGRTARAARVASMQGSGGGRSIGGDATAAAAARTVSVSVGGRTDPWVSAGARGQMVRASTGDRGEMHRLRTSTATPAAAAGIAGVAGGGVDASRAAVGVDVYTTYEFSMSDDSRASVRPPVGWRPGVHPPAAQPPGGSSSAGGTGSATSAAQGARCLARFSNLAARSNSMSAHGLMMQSSMTAALPEGSGGGTGGGGRGGAMYGGGGVYGGGGGGAIVPSGSAITLSLARIHSDCYTLDEPEIWRNEMYGIGGIDGGRND